MSSLPLATGLTLPLEAVTEKLGFLGRTGSGKTYAAQKLAELMHAAGAQFVALDPVGKWWSLRLAADGKSPGIALPVFGGLQGDVPLEPSAGKLIADVIVDRGLSAVVDVSQFESDADKARFMTDFGARFFFRKKADPSAVHLFIEEAQEFVPQNPQRDEARMLHAWTRIQKLGRNFGIGTSLLSQRPQEVNKKVLNQTEVLFVFQLTGPQEREAIARWIDDKGIDVDEDIAAVLPKLERGAPHVWSPSWLRISRVVRIAPKETYDASRTPKVGAKKTAVRELSPIDLQKIQDDMKATIERAKAEDPRELRRRIADLEKQLRDRPAATREIEKIVQVPVLANGQLDRAEKLAERVEAAGQTLLTEAAELRREMGRASAARVTPARPAATARPTAPAPMRPAPSRPAPRSERSAGPNDALPRGERNVLVAVAQYADGVERDQLSVLTGYKRSSRDTYLQRLREREFVVTIGDRIKVTVEGVAALGDDFEPLPTGEALRDHWMARLPEGERRVFSIVINAYPDTVEREAIDSATGYQRSSRDTYLQRLKSRRLVDVVGRGEVRASANLFG